MRITPEQLIKKFEFERSSRSNWDVHWQELADYILPRKSDITTHLSPGVKRNTHLFDSTAIQANELLAGALHGLLTNPHTFFFELTTGDEQFDQEDEVRLWLQDSIRRMHNTLNNTNFQTEMHEVYLDLGCFGTVALLMEEDERKVIRFSAKHISRAYIDENHLGEIDSVYRCFKWNARNIVNEYGFDNVGEKVQKAFHEGKEEEFEVIHGVYPRGINEKTAFEFWSQHVLKCDKTELRMGGFREFPYAVPRWSKITDEKYGRSPGMTALPDAKVVNKMDETVLEGAQKTINPPLQLPDDGFILPIKAVPGGLNYYRSGSTDRIEPIFNDARIDFGFQAMADRRERIRKSFFVDQLKLQEGPQMTATEVLQRTEDQMRLLGPLMGRLENELLRPIVSRLMEIMFRRGMFLPPPQILEGQSLDIRYSSLIAKAQRVSQGQNMLRAFEASAPYFQLDPASADMINSEMAVMLVNKAFGAPQEIIRTQREVEQIRQARAEAQAAELERQQIQDQGAAEETGSKTMKNLSDAGMDVGEL